MIEEKEVIQTESLSSFKLIKNSKGYGWEIKVYNSDPQLALEKTALINSNALSRFSE